MRYGEIVEADAITQANALRTQREKLKAANERAAEASQTYQSTVKAAHDSAAAAKKKLVAPPKLPAKPTIPGSSPKPLTGLPPIALGGF